MLFGWVAALSVLAAACDSPTLAPSARAGILINAPFSFDTALVRDTMVSVADSDTTDLWPDCTVDSSRCPGTDTIKIAQPNGDTVPVRVFGPGEQTTIVVGQDTFVFQLGILNEDNSTGGDLMGIVWKDGEFAGYFGHCVFGDGDNREYITTDPLTGKQYIHWENFHQDTTNTEMYHYIYDPSTNTLKIYHRPNGGTAVLIYQGPPIKDIHNTPPPDPQPGNGPYTSESQFPGNSSTPSGGTPSGGTPSGPGTPPAPPSPPGPGNTGQHQGTGGHFSRNTIRRPTLTP
jgi:hypothetical protein